MMDKQDISVQNVLRLSGAFCALLIGAAFSSGQEMLQYFTVYGTLGFLGLAVAAVVLLLASYEIQKTAKREQLQNTSEVFKYYCGNAVGRVYIALLVVLLYAEYVMMSAGSGAAFEEYFGMPNAAGRVIMMMATMLTVLMGQSRIVDILGFLGPVTVMFMLLTGTAACVMAPMTLSEGTELARVLELSDGSAAGALHSGVKYISYVILSIVPTWVVLGGRSRSLREAKVSSITEVAAFMLVCVCILTAQIKNVDLVANTQMPNLILSRAYMPHISVFFAVITLMAIYSVTVFQLWYTVDNFAKERTKPYYVLTVTLAVAGLFLSGLLPFDEIMDLLYSVGFWLGIVFLVFVCARICARRKKAADGSPAA